MVAPANEARYRVAGPSGESEELGSDEIRDWIRRGLITDATLVAPAQTEQWEAAAAYPQFQRYLALAASRARSTKTDDATDHATASPARLITYMTLAGLTAAILMGLIAPLCLIIGVFARFLLTTAALGAVLALGINSAFRESDSRVINISAAGFAAGGAVAWLFNPGGGEFRPLHLAIIGLAGGAGLAIALRSPLARAIPIVAAAMILFPLSIAANPVKPGSSIHLSGPSFLTPLLVLVLMILPAIPFALFGGILGAVLAFSPGARARKQAGNA